MRRVTRSMIALALIALLVVGCADDGSRPKLPTLEGPVDAFLGIIDQVSRLGESISRQFRGMTPRR